MSWDDEAIEYAKWKKPDLATIAMYDLNDDPREIYCCVHYDTLEKKLDSWNHEKWYLKITPIIRYPKLDLPDKLEDRTDVLSCGVRLFNALKKAKDSKWKYIRIFRLGVKFDTQYHVSEYKMTRQTKITEKPKKTVKGK